MFKIQFFTQHLWHVLWRDSIYRQCWRASAQATSRNHASGWEERDKTGAESIAQEAGRGLAWRRRTRGTGRKNQSLKLALEQRAPELGNLFKHRSTVSKDKSARNWGGIWLWTCCEDEHVGGSIHAAFPTRTTLLCHVFVQIAYHVTKIKEVKEVWGEYWHEHKWIIDSQRPVYWVVFQVSRILGSTARTASTWSPACVLILIPSGCSSRNVWDHVV